MARTAQAPKLSTLTVADLIEILQGESPDALVVFSTDFGDYHHTQQALPLRGELDTVTVQKSAYSNSGFAIVEPDEDGDDTTGDGDTTYLVIR